MYPSFFHLIRYQVVVTISCNVKENWFSKNMGIKIDKESRVKLPSCWVMSSTWYKGTTILDAGSGGAIYTTAPYLDLLLGTRNYSRPATCQGPSSSGATYVRTLCNCPAEPAKTVAFNSLNLFRLKTKLINMSF